MATFKRSPRRRAAFTLVELLVVIVIIGILVGLLLPAVNAARESGRMTTCKNNLKQIGVAFQTYHDKFTAYPNGGSGVGAKRTFATDKKTPLPFDSQDWGWGYQILPFIEQDVLWANTDDKVVAATPIVIYFCPTRRRPIAIKGGTWATYTDYRAMLDYAGNAGCSSSGQALNPAYGDGIDGIVIRKGRGRINDAKVTDGLSNTIIVSEKRMNLSYVTTECQADDNDGYVAGFQDDIVRWGVYVPQRDQYITRESQTTISQSKRQFMFGSSHAAGVQAVFGDGGVRLVSYQIELEIFRRACSINDHKPYSLDKLNP